MNCATNITSLIVLKDPRKNRLKKKLMKRKRSHNIYGRTKQLVHLTAIWLYSHRQVHVYSCIMLNQGKMAGNSKPANSPIHIFDAFFLKRVTYEFKETIH